MTPETVINPIFEENTSKFQGPSRPRSVILSDCIQIPWYRIDSWALWALFGNDDDGIYGEYSGVEGFNAENQTFGQAVKWWMRNPFHNFCFYVIGTAQRPNSNWILFECSPMATTYFQPTPENPDELFPSFTIAFNGGKPFFRVRWAYNKMRKGEIYFGWRERGNFGMKCQVYGKRINYYHFCNEKVVR